MPVKYLEWMEQAIAALKEQWGASPPIGKGTIQLLVCQCYGNNAGTDIDNLVGSVMDAMKKAGILAEDNVNHVPALLSGWERSKTVQWIDIELHFHLPTIQFES